MHLQSTRAAAAAAAAAPVLFLLLTPILCAASALPRVELYDPRERPLSEQEFEVIEYGSTLQTRASFSFLETGEGEDPQRAAPHRIECDCTFKKANPLGRPESAYHVGRLVGSQNEATKKKLQDLLRTNGQRNPGSKVEDLAPVSTGGSFLQVGGTSPEWTTPKRTVVLKRPAATQPRSAD